ncbi:MAG: BTAD domain-containing putative transcriptional regulator, partial [Burkholderiales bacterium]
YQLDAADGDPATFFHFLGRAAQCGMPSPFPAPGCDHLPIFAGFIRRWATALHAALPRPAVIVLDNYQMLPADAPLHAVIEALLGALPPDFKVIVASRTLPPPALAAWLDDPDFHTVDWEQLRLTEAEASTLARLHGTTDPSAIGAMLARTRGWMAGFVLQLLARSRGVTTDDAANGAQQTIFELLTTEMFDGLSQDQQARLVACALPPRISRAGACDIAGIEASNDLDALHAARLFVDRRVDVVGREIFEFHSLMREFLRMRAHYILGEDRIADVRRTLAQALEQEGRAEEAIVQWTTVAAWNEVTRVVVEHAPVMLSQGRSRVLSGWIDAVPGDIVDASGWLLYWQGVARGATDPLLGRADIERAYACFMAQNDSIGALLAAAAVLDQYFLAGADYTGVDAWLDRVEALYAQVESRLSPTIEATIIAGLGVCRDVGMAHCVWERVRRRLDALFLTSSDPRIVDRIATFGALFALCRGDVVSARRYQLRVDAADANLPPAALITGLVSGMALHCTDARHAEALAKSQRAYALLDTHTLPALYGPVTTATFHAQMSAGDIAAGAQSLDRLQRSQWSARSVERAQIETLRAILLFSRGEQTVAIDALYEPLAFLERIGARSGALRTRAQLGQFLWLAGRHEQARMQLQQVLEEAAALNAAHVTYLAHLWLAGSLLDIGNTTMGHDHLRQALASGRRHDYLNAHPLWVPNVMARLFASALEHDIETEHVRRVISHRNLQPPSPDREGWPWPIRVYTLGRFVLFIGDERFDHGRKAQRRVLDLLKAIIAFGGVGVGREQLAAALWPESDGASALNALEVTLYRLRKLLGRDDAVRLERGEVSLDRSIVWVDTLAFESLIAAVSPMDAGNGSIEEAAHAAGKAMRLYYGPFLRFEEDTSWQLPYQERLRSKFRRLMTLVARHWPASRAIDALERAIEIDPAAEELHRRLMTLLADGGRQAEAVEAYQRCERVLRVTLGVAPSAETRAVLQRLGVTRPMKGSANARAGAAEDHPSGSAGRARRGRA